MVLAELSQAPHFLDPPYCLLHELYQVQTQILAMAFLRWREVDQFLFCLSFFKDFIYLFLERGREEEREGEKHQCVVASHIPLSEDLAHNPGMCTDWKSNQRPFASQAGAQSTELHWPGLFCLNCPKEALVSEGQLEGGRTGYCDSLLTGLLSFLLLACYLASAIQDNLSTT